MNYTEMEFKVAGVLFEHFCDKMTPHHRTKWPNCLAHVREDYLALAKKAIRALVPVSEDMAHYAVSLGLADEMDCALIFRAMIEGASPERHEGKN